MNDPTPEQAKRRTAIAGLIEDIRIAHQAGKFIDRQTILDAHPELMPELSAELDKLERVEKARNAVAAEAAPFSINSHDGLSLASALAEDVYSAPVQIPGYTLLRELSRGGQGVVYLAMQLSTGRKVALKLLHEGLFASERTLARFRREVQSLAALNHPNIVAIIDTGKTLDGARFITMNYIAGMNLTDYMRDRQKKDPTDPSKLLRLFLKVCDAVNAAHRLGIIHRDLKPSNIRVNERGEPHILDFGLARTALDHALPSQENAISITGEFLGSLPWSSPEQADGNPEKIDIRTDVYSLGVILYQILTGGRFPYDVVGNMRDVLNNILTAEPIPPSRVARLLQKMNTSDTAEKPRLPMVNEAMERIVLKALAKNPDQRYASAGELGRDVARYLAGKKSHALSSGKQPTRFAHKASIVALILASLAACVTITAMIAYRSTVASKPLAISPPPVALVPEAVAKSPLADSAHSQNLPAPHNPNPTSAHSTAKSTDVPTHKEDAGDDQVANVAPPPTGPSPVQTADNPQDTPTENPPAWPPVTRVAPPTPPASSLLKGKTLTALAEIFGAKDAAQLHIDPTGVLTVTGGQKKLSLLGTERNDFAISGEMLMDSHDDPQTPMANGVKNAGKIDFTVRELTPKEGYRLNGKFLGAAGLVEGQPTTWHIAARFDERDGQWLPFRFDVTADAILASVGNSRGEIKGPLAVAGNSYLRIAPGAKLRKLALTIGAASKPTPVPAHPVVNVSPPPAP